MAQTQIVQHMVKILGKWYKRGDDEKSPWILLVTHENREINLVYWGKTIPAVPKDHTFLVSVTVDENHRIPEYTLVKEKGIKGPAFMRDLHDEGTEHPVEIREEIEYNEPTEDEINAAAEQLEQFEKDAAKEKQVRQDTDSNAANKSSTTAVEKLDRFQLSEIQDETQIVSEFKGHVIKEYVYEYRIKKTGQLIRSISYAGIKAIISNMGNMRITEYDVVKDEKDGFWYASVKIFDVKRNLDGVGLSECEIHKPFARRIAFSKALRNAYRSVIDEALILSMIEEWLKR